MPILIFFFVFSIDEVSYKIKKRKEFNKFLEPLYKKQWITYIEPPKGKPENVIEYVGRYSFKIAISNERIKDISNGIITFEYKDYKDDSKIKTMTVTGMEFIRRFLLHVLPKYFTKIKHYGLLANRSKKATIKLCMILIGQLMYNNFVNTIAKSIYKIKCPKCDSETFIYSFYYMRN